jgi:hypothetical protein
MPANSTLDWVNADSLAITDALIVFASLSLAIEIVWILSAELRAISNLVVRQIVLSVYALSVLLTTILFGVLAGEYDISAHLVYAESCAVGLNACNIMRISLGLFVSVWILLIGFLAYAKFRPVSFQGILFAHNPTKEIRSARKQKQKPTI